MDFIKNINYDDCITNLTSSIQKHFGLTPNYKTNPLVDSLLQEKDYDNIIVFIFDGMGNNVIDTNTTSSHFLQEHRIGKFHSTFPPTTANCTTSYVSGRNPIETGWLGWATYYKDTNMCVDNFPNVDSLTKEEIKGDNIAFTRLAYKPLGKEIEEATNGSVKYYKIMPKFETGGAKSLNDFFHRVTKLCNQPGKKYIYAYWDNPDKYMHDAGMDNDGVKKILNEIGKGLRNFQRKTNNTIGLVSADHGHINVTPIALYTYYDVMECLRVPFTCDARCPFFFIKDGYEKRFEELFNKYFGDCYKLLTKKEALEANLFGFGKAHPMYEDLIGDYVAVATSRYYFMLTPDSHCFKAHHAGGLIEEISIPLIVVKN